VAELLLLGTGAALTDGSREPTMLALRGGRSTVIIDCGANAARQLQRLGIPLDSVGRVILTHVHPDHTSGFPLLIEMLWLGGLRGELPVHGPAETINTVRSAYEQWDTSGWEGIPAPQWHVVSRETGAALASGPDFELTTAPGEHGSTQVIGVRARDLQGGGVIAYSADGKPSPGILSLAQGVDILVHEATGSVGHHSTAAQAATLARNAGARQLVLVHLAPTEYDLSALRAEAAAIFPGPVHIGNDLDRFTF
jgi:ribonuclease Z